MDQIQGAVSALIADGLVSAADGAQLADKLEIVEAMVASGNLNPAINHVNAFINKVNALVNSRRLSQISGTQLTSEANDLITHRSRYRSPLPLPLLPPLTHTEARTASSRILFHSLRGILYLRSMSQCPNCGAGADGAYCSSCGQSQGSSATSLRVWVTRLLDEQFALSGRLPVTVKLLFTRPGFLTAEWRQGRRARYVEPLRLYTFSLLVFLTILFTFGGVFDSFSDLMPQVRDPGMVRAARSVMEQELRRFTIVSLLVLVPAVATVLMGLFARGGIFFVEHMAFSLHVHAALMLLIAVMALAGSLHPALLLSGLGIIIGFPIYLHQAMKSAYADGERRSAIRVVALVLAYMTVFTAVAAVQWPPVEKRLMAEVIRLGESVERARQDRRAHEVFNQTMRMAQSTDTTHFRERVQTALEAQANISDPVRRMYHHAELYWLLKDTAAVRRLVRVGLSSEMRASFLQLDGRVNRRR